MLGFKPQPLNYSAQSESALRKLALLTMANGNPDEAAIMLWMADKIMDAVHFIMPEDGYVFDDEFKGIQGSEAHLPFPLITIEYQATKDPGVSADGKPLYKATRRVLLAMEISADAMLNLAQKFLHKGATLPTEHANRLLSEFPDGAILVTGIFYLDYKIPLWSPPYAAWLLPIKGWDKCDVANAIAPLRKGDERLSAKTGVTGRPFPLFWRAWIEMHDRLGREMTDRYVANDIGVESFVVLELIEALSCSNVKIGTIQSVKPNINARRIRDGKLPLYETKILTVNVSPKSYKEARGSLEGDRASPGEHLRRGHIQTYHTRQGPVNLWKQSITVAAGSPRAIKKSYKVKKGA